MVNTEKDSNRIVCYCATIYRFNSKILGDKMQYTTKELQIILDLHKKWLYNSEGGKYANLIGADLRGANLSGIKRSSENY